MNNSLVLLAQGLTKSFYQNGTEVPVLKGVNLQLAVGEQVAVVGRSGSGKSSLLHLLAGLDSADSGSVHIDGADLLAADANGRAQIRREKMGFVYQQHHLLGEFSAQENVAIPQRLLGIEGGAVRFRRRHGPHQHVRRQQLWCPLGYICLSQNERGSPDPFVRLSQSIPLRPRRDFEGRLR